MIRFVLTTAVLAAGLAYLRDKQLLVMDDSILIAAAFLALLGFVAAFGMRRNI